ncbi:MAG: PIG-L family deacetylase [Candidatus Marinimicrobia bacterium]|nr:PIG-L family deacetylase [Candidatus Neomarinimicrobiota bacterium]
MNLSQPLAEIFVPDGLPPDQALARTTHLALGAHQDDIEFMALAGVLACYRQSGRWFTGVTLTNGAGSPRAGLYAAVTDDEMQRIRVREQRQAAQVGEYGAMVQLMYPSRAVKSSGNATLHDELRALFGACRPEVVYLHNPADKHDTHVGSCLRALEALRSLPTAEQPRQVLGCEVWRDLDWLPDALKVVLPVAAHPNLAAALNGVFDSQITGGKRYDLAVQGRRAANATFLESHAVDQGTAVQFAMDLTPLLAEPDLTPGELVRRHLAALAEDIAERVSRCA